MSTEKNSKSGLLPIRSIGEQLFIDSRTVAESLEVQHKNTLDLVRRYRDQIEKTFGRVAFETLSFSTSGGNQPIKVALLTEEQATFVITLMKNSPRVVLFKALLTKSFHYYREALHNPLAGQLSAIAGINEVLEKLTRLTLAWENRLSQATPAPHAISQQPAPNPDFIDLRDLPVDCVRINGRNVRRITYNDEQWFNIGDLLLAIGTKTGTYMTARRINRSGKPCARKIYVYGSTHPAWYCNHVGMRKIFSRSNSNLNLLDF